MCGHEPCPHLDTARPKFEKVVDISTRKNASCGDYRYGPAKFILIGLYLGNNIGQNTFKRKIRIIDLVLFKSQVPTCFWPLHNNTIRDILIFFHPGPENNLGCPCRAYNREHFDSG